MSALDVMTTEEMRARMRELAAERDAAIDAELDAQEALVEVRRALVEARRERDEARRERDEAEGSREGEGETW